MSLGIGGAETHIVELAQELNRRGIDVMIASSGGVYLKDLEATGIRHFLVPMGRRKLTDMLKSFFLLRKIIKQEKPDIVHAHARISAFLCGLIQKTMHFPFVTTAHGVFQLGLGLNQLTNWGQKTLAVSEDIRTYLIENYGLDARNIVITINGIDTNKFSPSASSAEIIREFDLDTSRPIISHVSRLDDSSSLVAHLLISLAPRLAQKLPGVQIIITGSGNVFDSINQLAEAANRQTGRRTVIMTGARTDINEIISTGDLFIGVSRAALEAMAEAKPVILAGSQGYIGLFTPETLIMAQTSNFCGRGNALPTEQLLFDEIIRTLLTLPDETRVAFAHASRQLVVSDYSVNTMTDNCVAVYEAVRRRRYNVVISGYYGFGNSGDEAILQAIHQNIAGVGNDIAITVLSSDPEDTKSRYGCDAVYRFRLLSVLSALRRCDALVSGGGSLLQDHTSTRSLFYYLMIIRATQFFGKKVMIYANGIGPVRKNGNRRLVRRIVGRADVITLRDDVSAQELKSMGVTRNDIRVTADPVFTLNSASRQESIQLLDNCGLSTDKPFICVCVRNWNGMGAFSEKLAQLCDELHDKYDRNILFIAMQTPNDVSISHDVADLMKNTACVLDARCSAEQLMGVIALSDCMLAMRLHALIFAARVCVPLIGMIYDPKVAAYIEALDMLSAGDVKDFDATLAMTAVEAVMNDRQTYVERLRQSSARFESLAREDAQQLLRLLESDKKRRT